MRHMYIAAALGGFGRTITTAATTNSSCTFAGIKSSTELQWCLCETDLLCAKLKVPLDYLNPSQNYAAVPLIKSAATANSSDGPYQGMLVIIPGGPGGSGIDLLTSEIDILRPIIGSNWDIVSYDPRGIFRAEPALGCALNPSLPSANVSRREAVPRVSDNYYDSFLDYGKELGENCSQRSGAGSDAGPHMSTMVNVRDLLSIVDAYARSPNSQSAAKNASLLNFYAFSYGTVVGQTFASVYPDRVGNAVLDGVLNAEKYRSGWIEDSINHLDGVLALFFIYCSKAGPSLCPYATANSSAHDIFDRFKTSLTQLKAREAAAEHWANATDVEQALLTLKYNALNTAYFPLTAFGNFAQILVNLETALETGQLEQWTQQTIAQNGDPEPAGVTDFEYVLGVTCSDQNDLYYGRTREGFQPQIRTLEAQSIIGELWLRNPLGCAGWNIKSGDVFEGRFGGNTTTPMLFVSNTYDPVTPIENSHSAIRIFPRAQIVTVEGSGHTSEATLNTCSFGKIRAYLQDTQLPGQDSYCAVESTPFGVSLNGTLQENIQRYGLSNLHFQN